MENVIMQFFALLEIEEGDS